MLIASPVCVTVMIITSDLKWNTHISSTCAKARQQLGFLYRFFYMADSACLSHLYKCLVLPTLDYCSSVWDPAAVTLISQLESVQRFAARLVYLTVLFVLLQPCPLSGSLNQPYFLFNFPLMLVTWSVITCFILLVVLFCILGLALLIALSY